MAWKPEVKLNGNWSRNGLVFATKEEAEKSAADLKERWLLVEAARAVEVENLAVNYRYDSVGVIHPVKKEA